MLKGYEDCVTLGFA